ncbi:tyrosine-type recombinase/integrase [Acinetobacter sp. ANC 4640]
MALTDTWLKNNNGKPREKVEEVSDRDSMSARVSPKGKIVFQLRYRFAGKPYRIDLGTYPYMSLKDARTETDRLRTMLDQGKNPKTELAVEKQKHIDPTTLSDLVDSWYENFCKPQKKNHDQIKRRFENHILPKLGKLPADRISVNDWLTVFEDLAQRQPGTAKNLLSSTKQMMKWALKRELIENNSLSDIFPKEDLNISMLPSKRYLSDDELKILFECLKYSRLSEKNKIFIELCLIYGCRNGELRNAEKKHFDLKNKIWTVPPENHKTGYKNDKTLIRPIPEYAEKLITEAMHLNKSKMLFTGANDDEMMSNASSTALPVSIMKWVSRFRKEDMEHWSLHDLRRTARTNFSRLSDRKDIAEIMIGHSLPKIQETYDLYDYVKEQAEVYEKWIAKLNMLKNNG